jgi:hypothetical protein
MGVNITPSSRFVIIGVNITQLNLRYARLSASKTELWKSMGKILIVHRIPPISKLKHISAQHKVHFEMKRTHGNEEKWKVVHPRPAVDVRNVIYGLTSPDCTTAHPGVTKDTYGEMKRTQGNEEKWKVVLPRPTVDVRDVIYGLTSSDCTTAHPGVTKDTC